jgi:hypothetical protein
LLGGFLVSTAGIFLKGQHKIVHFRWSFQQFPKLIFLYNLSVLSVELAQHFTDLKMN